MLYLLKGISLSAGYYRGCETPYYTPFQCEHPSTYRGANAIFFQGGVRTKDRFFSPGTDFAARANYILLRSYRSNALPGESVTVTDNQPNSPINQSAPTIPIMRGFKLASLNVTSIIKHIDELRVLLVDHSIDVLAINETRLDSTINDNEVHISGYEIVRRDRSVNGRFGGGVCFYVRCNINFLPRFDMSIDQLENLCIEIRKPRSKPFLVTTWYRPPDSPVDKFNYFETLVGRLDAENVEYYLMGDLNCNFGSTVMDHNSTILTSITDLYGLQQLISEPTRITKSSSTLIDLIFTNSPDKIVCSGVSHISISDHSLIYAFRKLSTGLFTKGHSTVTYRKFKNFDSASFRNDIWLQNWDEIRAHDRAHFADIGPKLADKIPCNENSRSHLDYLSSNESGASTSFQLKTTSSSIVFSLLSKLSKSKATGLDKISARLLRECPDLISDSLSIIFNRSIITGIFPDDWKCSKVIPLFKQGKRKDLNNYRPISIIPIVAKVFERIIYDQFNFFLTDNKLLSTSQSGFRSLHSTVTALLEATNDWAYNIDHGNVNAVVFLDLKKAFDTVDHAILLSKLNAYGIESEWFKSYLSDRDQKCFVNGFLSPNRSLSCGIPQGTILGPLLFLIYINDLPNCLEHSQARMYADDTHLTLASNNVRDINQNLNQDLVNVSEWLIANKLTLNQSKTEFMLIGSRQRLCTLSPLPSLEIDGIPVNQVSLTKSLGVLIDENLSWNMHINKLIKKIASSIGAIKRVRPFVPFTTLQYIYNSLVQPHFNYCCVVWDNCNKTYADKLQKLQNRAARVLTSSSYDIAADFLLEKLGWRKLDTQRKLEKAVMVYKSLNGLAPDYLRPMFIDRSSITNYSLRDTEGKLAIPKPRTNYLKNSFGYSGAVLWNSLPTELRKTNNLSVFKSGCSRFFK